MLESVQGVRGEGGLQPRRAVSLISLSLANRERERDKQPSALTLQLPDHWELPEGGSWSPWGKAKHIQNQNQEAKPSLSYCEASHIV